MLYYIDVNEKKKNLTTLVFVRSKMFDYPKRLYNMIRENVHTTRRLQRTHENLTTSVTIRRSSIEKTPILHFQRFSFAVFPDDFDRKCCNGTAKFRAEIVCRPNDEKTKR